MLRQIIYEPLVGTVVDLDIALYWFCKEAAIDVDFNVFEFHSAKIWINIRAQYESANPLDANAKKFEATLSANPTVIGYHPLRDSNPSNPNNPYRRALRILADRVLRYHANYIREKSGLVLTRIINCTLCIIKYNPIGAAYAKLPSFLAKKKAIINVRNHDNRCFGYAVLSAIMDPLPGHRKSEASYYTEEDFKHYGLDKLDYPVAVETVQDLELQLQTSFNLFSFWDSEGRGRYTMQSSRRQLPREIDLLYWNDHYAWIKDFGALVHDITKHEHRLIIHKPCFTRFSSTEQLANHVCSKEDWVSIQHILPPPNTMLEFKAYKYQTRAPFVIYADFECLVEPINEHIGHSVLYQQHRSIAAAALLCSPYAAFNNTFWMHTGLDAVDRFLNKMIEWELMCVEYLKANCKMRTLSEQQDIQYNEAKVCCICHNKKQPFDSSTDDWRKVRDHDHVTGYYIGAAHNLCNKRRRVVFQIPIFIHNFRGYDSHLIVQCFQNYPEREIKVIGQSMEKYMQVSWGKNLVFRDSLQHLSSSLERLVESEIKVGLHKFKHLANIIKQRYGSSADWKLLCRKGVFPYEYLNSVEVLEQPQLPPREAFASRLNETECSESDYIHAQKVWNEFRCEKFQHYLELYLLTDVGLLSDVFESFRFTSKEAYELDPVYHVSAPHLAMNAMLRYIKQPIELISDVGMYQMIHPAVRGGICHPSVRFARANNKYMGSLYNPKEESSFICYFDKTNLYGDAMSKDLPYGGYENLSAEECRAAETALSGSPEARDAFFFVDREKHGPYYIFQVDLEYPPEIHDRDDDYPMAPELMDITPEMLSETHHRLLIKYYNSNTPSSKKLVCSLLNKQKYVVFGPLLHFYLNRGMRLTKVHWGMRFKASPYIKGYIQNNTTRRFKHRNDETKKNFYKLMNNAPYGKTIENVAKRTNIMLVTDPEKMRKLAEKPHCIDVRVFGDFFGVELRKTKSVINKPFQVCYSNLNI